MTAVFGVVTVATMLATVAVALTGLKALRWEGGERYAHALAGGTIALCGLAIVFLGV